MFESSFDLYAEPKRTAERVVTLSPGMLVIVANNLIYTDVDDISWSAIIDEGEKKFLGWAELDKFQNAPKKYIELGGKN